MTTKNQEVAAKSLPSRLESKNRTRLVLFRPIFEMKIEF